MICGHMRALGEERVLHVCIKTDIVHEDEHLLVPWQEYADATAQHAHDRDQEVPEWFAVLDAQARHLNRQEFIKALREDPMLREVPADDPPPPLPDESDPPHIKDSKWQARTAWEERQRERRQQQPEPEPEPEQPDGYSLGRSQGDTWQEVTENDPDAWKPPDDADRAVEPPPGGPPEADLGYAPGSRGKPPRLDLKLDFPGGTGGGAGGASMASVAEVKAALDAAVHTITEAQGLIQATTEKIGEAEGMALAAAKGSGHDSITGGNAFLAQAKQDVEGALQTLQAAIEAYQQYGAVL